MNLSKNSPCYQKAQIYVTYDINRWKILATFGTILMHETNQPFLFINGPIIMLEIIKINMYQSLSSNNYCHCTPVMNEVMNVKMF